MQNLVLLNLQQAKSCYGVQVCCIMVWGKGLSEAGVHDEIEDSSIKHEG